jgi:serine protease DegS
MTLRDWLWYIARFALLGLIVAAVVIAVQQWSNKHPQPLLSESPASYATAVNRAAPAVVNIYSIGELPDSYYSRRPGSVLRLGSGVIMDNRGHILTAHHVVADVSQIQVALQDGRQYSGQVIGFDRVTDLAVVRIEADNLPVILTNDQLQPRVGDVVLAIGNPLNLGQTITQGIISATGGRMGVIHSHADLIQMDAAISEGTSGGALVNSQGYLVGINNAQFRSPSGQGVDGIYFAIPYPLAKTVMTALVEEGEVVRGYLGVNVGEAPNTAEIYRQPGIFISAVDRASPAEEAGLRPEDYVIEIGGKPVSSAAQGLNLVAESKPGTELEVKFYRGQQLMTTVVTIRKLP